MNELTDNFLASAEQFDGPVLVTGAGGCVASWVLAILTRSGIPCVAADLRDDRTRPSLIHGFHIFPSHQTWTMALCGVILAIIPR